MTKKERVKELVKAVAYINSFEKTMEEMGFEWSGQKTLKSNPLNACDLIVHEIEEGKFDNYVVINPKIVSNSMEQIYVDGCEGCLSVNRPIDGIVPRYARITVEYYDEFGQKHEKRIREEIAVAFQHEIDHLNGILFVDKIDKKDPFKNQDNMRAI